MDKLYMIMPTYNEEANIKKVINQWYPIIEDIGNGSKLVIINDGSKDNTLDIIRSETRNKKDLLCLSKPNSGHGPTIFQGYKYAIKAGADYIFQTDSDGQTLPEEFDEFWNNRNKYDLIIGNRNKRKDGFSRIIVSRVLRVLLGLIFGVFVLDANTPYRLMKAEKLERALAYIPKNYNLTNVIIPLVFYKKGYRVKYLPITFRPRQGGVNSINIKKIFKIGISAMKDFIRINKSLKSK